MHNIINPCCTERELGQLLREAHGHAVMFQTQGDVTMTTLLKATMLMSGDRPRTLTISAPTLPQEAMRLVDRYAQLGYISRLRLMLEEGQEGQRGLVRGTGETEDHVPVPTVPSTDTDLPTDLAIVPHAPSLLMWQGSTGTVVIQGHVPDVVTPALHLYAAILGGSQSVGVLNAIAPFEALFRARKVGHGDEGQRGLVRGTGETEDHVPVPTVPDIPEKKRKTTKTKKDNEKSSETMAAEAPTEESK